MENSYVKIENKASGTVYYHNFKTNQSKWELDATDTELEPLDPYHNPTTMPLREFIEHPLVRDTIHNGATLQTLGLTNYSHLPAALRLRQCVEGLPTAKEAMTKAALARLGTMHHVGVTDQLVESIESVAVRPRLVHDFLFGSHFSLPASSSMASLPFPPPPQLSISLCLHAIILLFPKPSTVRNNSSCHLFFTPFRA
jgi:hypothetical protein